MAENQKEKYLEEIEDQIRTIGVLTSGGDAPGMNAAIRAVVRSGMNGAFKRTESAWYQKRISRTFEGGDH